MGEKWLHVHWLEKPKNYTEVEIDVGTQGEEEDLVFEKR